jgi:hypothetical protein
MSLFVIPKLYNQKYLIIHECPNHNYNETHQLEPTECLLTFSCIEEKESPEQEGLQLNACHPLQSRPMLSDSYPKCNRTSYCENEYEYIDLEG